jgi:hypothetical protein
VLEEGVAGVDDCLIDFVGEVDCAVVRPRPPRQLDLQEISPLLTAFSTVLVHEEPDRICRDVIFDPCLINVLSWDGSQVNDFICGGRRIDGVESSRILGLLEELSQAAE